MDWIQLFRIGIDIGVGSAGHTPQPVMVGSLGLVPVVSSLFSNPAAET